MKIERTKNASRSILVGVFLKVYQMLLPFIMRTAMLYFLGVQYLGLNSLFTSILQVLNLAELGVGAAMVFSMYKPIAEDDTESICGLMKLYKLYYKVIGAVILTVGVMLIPFIPKLIKGTIPSDINIYVLYVLNLSATVLSYWAFAYKNSILQAHQRTDVTSKVLIVTETLKYALQLIVLAVFHNYYYYVMVILLSQLLTNIITAVCADKMYPLYKPQGELPKETIDGINQRIKDLFTAKVGTVVINSADTLVISAFLGLTVLAIYQNYFYLITAVIGVVSMVFNSCIAGIGNSLIVESKEKNYEDLKKLTFIISWLAGVCTVFFLCLFQPFMKIWVGEKLMFDFSVVICFCIYFFIYEINALLNLYKDASGMWHEDRFRPLVTALSNLVLNIILVQFIGIFGVLLSTVLTMVLIGMPWLLHNLFTIIFKRNAKEYLMNLFLYVIVTAGVCGITYMVVDLLPQDGIISFVVKIIVAGVMSNVLYWVFLHKKKEYKQSKELLFRMLKRGK